MGQLLSPKRGPRVAFKRSTSPLTTGTLWTYTGGIAILGAFGIVRTVIQSQATTAKLSAKNDALTAVDLCGTGDLNALVAGTIVQLPAALATALPVTATNGVALGLLALPIYAICTTSGIITVTYGAASTGVVDWYLRWEPITTNASVV